MFRLPEKEENSGNSVFYLFITIITSKLAVAFLSPQAQTLPALHRAMRENPSRATKIAYVLIWLQLITFIVIALLFGLKYFQAAFQYTTFCRSGIHARQCAVISHVGHECPTYGNDFCRVLKGSLKESKT